MTSMACIPPRKSMANERGQAILEFLPVAVLLLGLTFAVVDFGRAIWQQQVIIGLTREGSNLASRNTSLAISAAAVVSDGGVLNLAGQDSNNNGYGKVIITSVQNVVGVGTVITGQTTLGTLSATSRFVVFDQTGTQAAVLPATTPIIPQPGATVYVTEIFSKFSPITPLGTLLNYTMPSTLHDVAYF